MTPEKSEEKVDLERTYDSQEIGKAIKEISQAMRDENTDTVTWSTSGDVEGKDLTIGYIANELSKLPPEEYEKLIEEVEQGNYEKVIEELPNSSETKWVI